MFFIQLLTFFPFAVELARPKWPTWGLLGLRTSRRWPKRWRHGFVPTSAVCFFLLGLAFFLMLFFFFTFQPAFEFEI